MLPEVACLCQNSKIFLVGVQWAMPHMAQPMLALRRQLATSHPAAHAQASLLPLTPACFLTAEERA